MAELFARVEREHGRLDLLVNNAWGGHESFNGVFEAPFWEHPLAHWDSMFDRGVRNHLLASRYAAPIMVRQRRGLIVTTTFWDRDRYLRGNLYYDLAKAAMNRLAFGMAQELRPHGVASLAVSPGWMRTEFVLAGHKTDEAHWQRAAGTGAHRIAALPGPRRRRAGRATRQVMRQERRGAPVADLAREYGFTDIDGRQVPAFEMGALERRVASGHPPRAADDLATIDAPRLVALALHAIDRHPHGPARVCHAHSLEELAFDHVGLEEAHRSGSINHRIAAAHHLDEALGRTEHLADAR